MTEKRRQCTVLGCGVAGLTSAIVLQRSGFQVTIVARATPHLIDATYVSDKAGAHWFSFAAEDDKRQQDWDFVTFREMARIARTAGNHGIHRPMGNQLFTTKPAGWKDPWWATLLAPEWSHWDRDALEKIGIKGFEFGIRYRSIMMDAGRYIKWLYAQFEELGGKVVVRTVSALSELYTAPTSSGAGAGAAAGERFSAPELVVNCTGLGAALLDDVRDKNLYPVRGQTLLVHDPAVTDLWRSPGSTSDWATYILPRGDGHLIVGGTFQDGDSNLGVVPKTASQILTMAARIVPALAEERKPTIVAQRVGLRPARKGGIRLEIDARCLTQQDVVRGAGAAESKQSAASAARDAKAGGSRLPLIVHNYGHGGYGFQSSWGCAFTLRDLVQQHFEKLSSTSSTATLSSKL